MAHTVTSFEDTGQTFDSGLINAGETYLLDTSTLEVREYEYFCIVHPWMQSLLVVGDTAVQDATIPEIADQ